MTSKMRALKDMFRHSVTRKDYYPGPLYGGNVIYAYILVCGHNSWIIYTYTYALSHERTLANHQKRIQESDVNTRNSGNWVQASSKVGEEKARGAPSHTLWQIPRQAQDKSLVSGSSHLVFQKISHLTIVIKTLFTSFQFL